MENNKTNKESIQGFKFNWTQKDKAVKELESEQVLKNLGIEVY